MKQVSAKARRRKAREGRLSPPPLSAQESSHRAQGNPWWWGGGVLAAAAVLRFLFLTLKPLHHDEGVNGLFLTTLFRTGKYYYDPSNFHGPTLYYFALVTAGINNIFHWGSGLSTVAIRMVPALFGIGIVWLILCLRRQLGTFAVFSAAAIATVSPGFVYFSRYFIHEIPFVFFTLGIVVAWIRYRENGNSLYFLLAAASAGLLFATKETWIITVAVWLCALLCTRLYLYLSLRRNPESQSTANARNTKPNKNNAVRRQEVAPTPALESDTPSNAWLYATAALVFVTVGVLFYSSFFLNFPKGVYDSVRTFGYWTKTGQTDDPHVWFTYFNWLWQEEAPILVLGSAGIAIALFQARHRFAVFTSFWSMGILAAYSLITYKTPWLALSIMLPLTLMAGYGLGQCYERISLRVWFVRIPLRVATPLVTGAAVAFSLYQAIDISFFHYDDDSYAYVYAHTRRDFLSLVHEIESIAASDPAGKDIGITVMSPEHWPLPWYLRDYTHVGYWGHVVPTSEPMVIALEPQTLDVERMPGDKYRLYSSHDLRPGNLLVLYVRKDIRP